MSRLTSVTPQIGCPREAASEGRNRRGERSRVVHFDAVTLAAIPHPSVSFEGVSPADEIRDAKPELQSPTAAGEDGGNPPVFLLLNVNRFPPEAGVQFSVAADADPTVFARASTDRVNSPVRWARASILPSRKDPKLSEADKDAGPISVELRKWKSGCSVRRERSRFASDLPELHDETTAKAAAQVILNRNIRRPSQSSRLAVNDLESGSGIGVSVQKSILA